MELYQPSSGMYYYKKAIDTYIKFKIRPLTLEFVAGFTKDELMQITYHLPGYGGDYAKGILDYDDKENMNKIKNLINPARIPVTLVKLSFYLSFIVHFILIKYI